MCAVLGVRYLVCGQSIRELRANSRSSPSMVSMSRCVEPRSARSRLHHLRLVILVAGVPALPVVAGVPALPVLVTLPVLVPGAIVPVALVAGFTVVPVVVVAAAPVPVAAPPWIPPLAGAPVIIRERRGLGLGDGSRPKPASPKPAVITTVDAATRAMFFMPEAVPASVRTNPAKGRFHHEKICDYVRPNGVQSSRLTRTFTCCIVLLSLRHTCPLANRRESK
jgi:hypothetical protein